MGEDICGWELSLKALCRFIRVGRKCSYIGECSHPRVRARRSDDRAAVRVPNQDYGTADPLQSPSHVGDILGVRIESVLRCDHLMSLGQKGRDEFAEARAVCPEAVDEDDAGFALIWHIFAPFVQECRRGGPNRPPIERLQNFITARPTMFPTLRSSMFSFSWSNVIGLMVWRILPCAASARISLRSV